VAGVHSIDLNVLGDLLRFSHGVPDVSLCLGYDIPSLGNVFMMHLCVLKCWKLITQGCNIIFQENGNHMLCKFKGWSDTGGNNYLLLNSQEVSLH
jgi:hypothetical protein